MKLREFIDNFIGFNSTIRLWYQSKTCGHTMVINDAVEMDWKIQKGNGIYSDFINHEVLYVTSIVTDKDQDAINIVIKEELAGDYDNGLPKLW